MSDVALRLSRRGVPMVHQDEAAECGLACLAMIAGYHGHEIDMLSLRVRFGASMKGMTLATLLQVADQMKLDARPLRGEPEDLREVALPAILHWGLNHFVVLTAIKGRGAKARYLVNDPALGARSLSREELSKLFTGVLIELHPAIAFERRRERAKLSLWQLWSSTSGLVPALGRILILSLLIELFVLAAPFYLQLGIDNVIPSQDQDFLTALALGFGAVAILSQVTSLVRAWSVAGLSNELGYRLVSNLFRHMARLPVPWFERRSVGDVLTRFNATHPITDLLSGGLIQAVIDACLSTITLGLMFLYSPMLSLVTLAALGIYVLLRLAYFGSLKAESIGIIQAQAAEQAMLIETIRGIVPIRLFGRERERLRVWQTRRVQVVNASVRIARMQAIFSAANSATVALENILFVYLAIRLSMANAFTVGMITAFAAYKQQFLNSSLNVVGRAIDYRMLDVQLGRIGDIALTAPEPRATPGGLGGEIETIELEGIRFAYAIGDPEILQGVDLSIRRGETLAIVGASGSGKTTLLKLLLGLAPPSEGHILVNGRRLTPAMLGAYREQVASVMQDDQLFAGTIAENIAFFDPEIDLERVEDAARRAIIHDDIMAMPMAYESLVGDMGSALSGGQKQRVLLARALYRSPRLLVMDEATAHLDGPTEARVNASLREMGLSCVVVAHRDSTIANADRVLELERGRIIATSREEEPGEKPDLTKVA
ncbi:MULTISPECIES: peptidase domain-containing ABC transporter [unclassified Sphingomonas]|uniref:peptidase domain-containing ABC transporter n=1 Tax=Sphingomonas TaxID=13687 RepID=UPI000AFFD948|nr:MULTISPECIES: peptidase domain-containing ABC transporter [unclassified Sphingomonas]MBN8809887.1 peptidase domain-containing ABC transporter [Sphingomonas sp.]